jgi:hypothetical protein
MNQLDKIVNKANGKCGREATGMAKAALLAAGIALGAFLGPQPAAMARPPSERWDTGSRPDMVAKYLTYADCMTDAKAGVPFALGASLVGDLAIGYFPRSVEIANITLDARSKDDVAKWFDITVRLFPSRADVQYPSGFKVKLVKRVHCVVDAGLVAP